MVALLMVSLLTLPSLAAEVPYTFTIKVSDTEVEIGEKITVSLEIKNNSGKALEVFSMQDYVEFDMDYFVPIEGSLKVTNGFNATVQQDCIYVNRFSTKALTVSGSTVEVFSVELEALKVGNAEFGHSVAEMLGDKLVSYKTELVDADVEIKKGSGSTPIIPDDSDKLFNIDVPSRISHGDIAVSHVTAKKGTAVKIIVAPDADYELDELEVIRSDNRTVRLTDNGNGSWSFAMPGYDVEIYVSFKKIETDTPDTPDTPDDPTEPPVHECPSAVFTDLDVTQWYHEAVDYVIENKLMNGMSAEIFAPNGTTTRAMIATILWRQHGKPTVDGDIPFTDVKAGEWYADAVRWAAANGIVNGYGNGTFGPNDTITREQFATMLYRYEKAYGNKAANASDYKLNFTDADKVSDWALEAMRWCNKNGIINGMGDGVLLPQGNATRAQAAQMLMNYSKK